jgi:uncharacterized membrane protein
MFGTAISAFIITLTAIMVLFLPGFSLSFVLFDRGKIDWLERGALSFALSISIVPLVAFYLTLIGFKINFALIFLIIFSICYLSTVLYVIRYYQRRSKHYR